MKRALITGISGQDGTFLTKSLLDKGWEVLGTTRKFEESKFKNLDELNIRKNVEIIECDLLDVDSVNKCFKNYNPDLVFNLSAQSSVGQSLENPRDTIYFNTVSALNLLDVIKTSGKDIKLFQASSCEIFGDVENLPLTEDTPKKPLNPYAVSKTNAYWNTVNYRETYGIKSCSGILFNHESIFRNDNFFTKKIVRESLEIKNGKRKNLLVGNIDISRDMGCAKEYVEAMLLMVLKNEMSDFLICSGTSVTLRSMIEHIFNNLGIDHSVLKQDESFFRSNEKKDIYGDPSKAKSELGWSAKRTIFEVLDEMIEYEKEKMHS